MFGLQAQLAPKMNGIQVGFPYVMQFFAERAQKRAAEAAAVAKPEPPKPPEPPPVAVAKVAAEGDVDEALLN